MTSRATAIRKQHRRQEILDLLEPAYPNYKRVVEIGPEVSFSRTTARKICKRMHRDDELDGRKCGGTWEFRALSPASGGSASESESDSESTDTNDNTDDTSQSVLEKVRADIEAARETATDGGTTTDCEEAQR